MSKKTQSPDQLILDDLGLAVESAPVDEDDDLLIQLKKPVQFDDREITAIDLRPLRDATMADLVTIFRNWRAVDKTAVETLAAVQSLTYCSACAAWAMDLPIDFFGALPAKTGKAIGRTVLMYMSTSPGMDDDSLIVKFDPPVEFEGKEIKEIDLTGLEDLTTNDLETIKKQWLKVSPEAKASILPEQDPSYPFVAATKVTGLPYRFFLSLPALTATDIGGRINRFFSE